MPQHYESLKENLSSEVFHGNKIVMNSLLMLKLKTMIISINGNKMVRPNVETKIKTEIFLL